MKIVKKVIDVLPVVSGDDIRYTDVSGDLILTVRSKSCYEIVIKRVDISKSLKDVKD